MQNTNYKFCIDCWRPETEVRFNNREWQFNQRCIDCERLYVQEYLDRYPNTKTAYKHRNLSVSEIQKIRNKIALERYFNNE